MKILIAFTRIPVYYHTYTQRCIQYFNIDNIITVFNILIIVYRISVLNQFLCNVYAYHFLLRNRLMWHTLQKYQ